MKYLLMIAFISSASTLAIAQENDNQSDLVASLAWEPILCVDPLYVVSRSKIAKIITKEEFEKINTRDIEYIKVLNDGAAIDIYGEKGKNGVVLIVMKNNSFSGRYPGRPKSHSKN